MAVPFLSDAACYDLLGVLVKQSRAGHTRLPLPGWQGQWVLQPVGLLPNLLEQTGSDIACAHCTWEYSPNGRAETAYEEMRLLDGQPRQIRLHMGGLCKKVTFLLLPPGQVSLHQTLPWLRSTTASMSSTRSSPVPGCSEGCYLQPMRPSSSGYNGHCLLPSPASSFHCSPKEW